MKEHISTENSAEKLHPQSGPDLTPEQELQLEHLKIAGVNFNDKLLEVYFNTPDIIEVDKKVPLGYRFCTKCRQCKKVFLFNKNSTTKDGHTVTCKECQKAAAKKSYENTKGTRDYKAYYQANKERMREQGKRYYQEHKEELKRKRAKYRQSAAGKAAMHGAHRRRAKSLQDNKGIPYTREMVIERDRQGGPEPICYLCGKPIASESLTTPGAVHLDHVVPVVLGGIDCFSNVACVHDTCNLSKTKEAAEISADVIAQIVALTDAYIDTHQEQFPDIFGEKA